MTDQAKITRGGQPEMEKEHAKVLLAGGEKEIWGWGTPAGKQRVQNRVAWFTNSCGLGPGVRVLECGCGVGVFSRELAKTGADITAVDIAEPLLEKAREECSAPNVKFVQTNLEEPDLPVAAFDVICGVSILHHLNMPKALRALRIHAAPGARFAFSEPNILNPINKYYLFTPDMEARKSRGVSPTEMAFHPDELRKLFEEAEYTVSGVAMRDFLHPSIPQPLIPVMQVLGSIAESLPLVKLWSGSIWIQGTIN